MSLKKIKNYCLVLIVCYIYILELINKWLSQLNELSVTDPAVCPNMCGRKYRGKKRKYHLKRHLTNECGVPRKFQCHVCFKRFTQDYNLRSHLIIVHEQVPMLKDRFHI